MGTMSVRFVTAVVVSLWLAAGVDDSFAAGLLGVSMAEPGAAGQPNGAGGVVASPVRSTAETTSTTSAMKEWTFLIYLSGNNDLADSCVKNVNDMELVGSNDRVNVVVQLATDRTTVTRRLIQRDEQADKVTSPIIEELARQDMGVPETLEAFLRWGMERYPAKRFFVDIAGHGTGWMVMADEPEIVRGVSYDYHSGHHLSVVQVGDVLRRVTRSLGRKIDVLGYDACLMQMAEVAVEVADSCSYQIGSEENESAYGWPYDRWLREVIAHPEWDGVNVGQSLVAAYQAHYAQWVSTISMVDLSKIDGLKTKIDAFSRALQADPVARSKVKDILGSIQSYEQKSNKDVVDFVDQLLKKIDGGPVAEAGDSLRGFITRELVVANAHTGLTMERSNGLAIWLPKEPIKEDQVLYGELRWAKDTLWDELIAGLVSSGER